VRKTAWHPDRSLGIAIKPETDYLERLTETRDKIGVNAIFAGSLKLIP
jgi:hypothetical protein